MKQYIQNTDNKNQKTRNKMGNFAILALLMFLPFTGKALVSSYSFSSSSGTFSTISGTGTAVFTTADNNSMGGNLSYTNKWVSS